jgi:hypothetical protein
MRSTLTIPTLGVALMVLSPVLALGLGGSEAFFPVVGLSLLGTLACLMGEDTSAQIGIGQLTAELVQELASADQRDRELVLGCLNKRERDWFLAELPRAEAELRRRFWRPRKGAYVSIQWRWRIRLASKLA